MGATESASTNIVMIAGRYNLIKINDRINYKSYKTWQKRIVRFKKLFLKGLEIYFPI